MKLTSKLVIAGCALVVLVLAGVAIAQSVRLARAERARRDAQNAVALLDTTRVVLEDSVARVFERLSEQRAGNVELTGRMRALARENDEKGRALLRFRVLVDSLTNIVTTGTVTALDSSDDVRRLTAALDSNGVEVGIEADVPRPPADARVTWSFAMEPLNVLASITSTPEGAAVFRAEVDRRVRVIVDSVVVTEPARSFSLLQMKLPWWTNVLTFVAGGLVVCAVGC